MPREYNPNSVRNRPGLTIRPALGDRQLIAAFAKRWRCGVSEAAVRLAMIGAEAARQDSTAGRVEQLVTWLTDGRAYHDVLADCREQWGCSDDDAHRLLEAAMPVATEESSDLEILKLQRLWHASRQQVVNRFGSLERARLQGRNQGFVVIAERNGSVVDALTGLDMRAPLKRPTPWSGNRGGFKVF